MVHHHTIQDSLLKAFHLVQGRLPEGLIFCLFIGQPDLPCPEAVGPIIIFCPGIKISHTGRSGKTVIKSGNLCFYLADCMADSQTCLLICYHGILLKRFSCLHIFLHLIFFINKDSGIQRVKACLKTPEINFQTYSSRRKPESLQIIFINGCHPLTALDVTPSMKNLWQKRNATMIGIRTMVADAICAP